MSDGYAADVDRLARRSADFPDLADRARRVAETVRATLDATGAPWGEDEVGSSFAAAHAGPAAQAWELLSGLGDDLADVGARFSKAAAGYRASEEDVMTGLSAAGGGLDAAHLPNAEA